MADVDSLVNLLAHTFDDGTTVICRVLDRAKMRSWRVAATKAPYACKGALKRRGYRWNAREEVWAIELFYEAFTDGQADDLLARMCSLVPQEALVVGEVQGGEVTSGTEQLVSIALPMIEEGALASTNTFVLQGHEQQLEELAEAFGILLADPDAPIVQQPRRLADRVQALWLTYRHAPGTARDRFRALAAFCSYQESGAARADAVLTAPPNPPSGAMKMTNFLIIDTESAWDEHLHEPRRAVEPPRSRITGPHRSASLPPQPSISPSAARAW